MHYSKSLACTETDIGENSPRNATMAMPSVRAGRTRGAMFLVTFGAAWLVMWCLPTFVHRLAALVPIGLATTGLLWMCMKQSRSKDSDTCLANDDTPERKRSKRVFYVVNTVQWLSVFVAINVLNNAGHPEWITATIILIVGLHFFPLARAFRHPAHHITGMALVLLAAVYPQLATGGAADPVGALGAGIILWVSALWSLLAPVPARQ